MSESELATEGGFTFIWTIKNFNFCVQRKDERLYSPVFDVESLENTNWSLLICPRGFTDEAFISAFLQRNESGPQTAIAICYEISFLGSDGSPLVSKNASISFNPNVVLGWPDYLKRDRVFGRTVHFFLTKNALTIRCRLWKSEEENPEMGQCYVRSRIGIERKTSIWTIERFSSLQTFQERIVRFEFKSKEYPPLDMKLFVSDCSSCERRVCIEISKGAFKNRVFCSCKLSALDAKGKIIKYAKGEAIIDEENWRFPQFISGKKLNEKKSSYLPRDNLFLRYEIAISVGNVVHELDYPERFPGLNQISDNRFSALKDDLSILLKEQSLSDFRLRIGNRTLHVHKAILGARSPVFKAAFISDMKEKSTGLMKITDLNLQTVRQMLSFLYTDTIGDLDWGSACKLFTAADKYDIKPLRAACLSYLKSNLSASNACELLFFANLQQDSDMKTIAQAFIVNRGCQIFSSDAWKALMVSEPQLTTETMYLKCTEE